MLIQFDHRGTSEQIAQIRAAIGDPPPQMFPNITWPRHPAAGHLLAEFELPTERQSLKGVHALVIQIMQWFPAKRPAAGQIALQVQQLYHTYQQNRYNGDCNLPLQDIHGQDPNGITLPIQSMPPSPPLTSAEAATVVMPSGKMTANTSTAGQVPHGHEKNRSCAIAAVDEQPEQQDDTPRCEATVKPKAQPQSQDNSSTASTDKANTDIKQEIKAYNSAEKEAIVQQPPEIQEKNPAKVAECSQPMKIPGTPVQSLFTHIPTHPQKYINHTKAPSTPPTPSRSVLISAHGQSPLRVCTASAIVESSLHQGISHRHPTQVSRLTEPKDSGNTATPNSFIPCASCYVKRTKDTDGIIDGSNIPPAMNKSWLCKDCTIEKLPDSLQVLHQFTKCIASMEQMTMADISAMHTWRESVPKDFVLDIPTAICLAWLKNPEAIDHFTQLQQDSNNWEPNAKTLADWLWQSVAGHAAWDKKVKKGLSSGRPTGALNAIRCLGVAMVESQPSSSRKPKKMYVRSDPISHIDGKKQPWILEALISQFRGMVMESFETKEGLIHNNSTLHSGMKRWKSKVNPHRPKGSKLSFGGSYLVHHLIRKVLWTLADSSAGFQELDFQDMINMGIADEDGVITSTAQVCTKEHMDIIIPGDPLRWSCDACCLKPVIKKFGKDAVTEAIQQHAAQLARAIQDFQKAHNNLNPSYMEVIAPFLANNNPGKRKHHPGSVAPAESHETNSQKSTDLSMTKKEACTRFLRRPPKTQTGIKPQSHVHCHSTAHEEQQFASLFLSSPSQPSGSLHITPSPSPGTPVISQVSPGHTLRYLQYQERKEQAEQEKTASQHTTQCEDELHEEEEEGYGTEPDIEEMLEKQLEDELEARASDVEEGEEVELSSDATNSETEVACIIYFAGFI